MVSSHLANYFQGYQLEHFTVQTLVVTSKFLKGNPLKDPMRRFNPLLLPNGKTPKTGWPVVIVLAGFTGNGPNYFNVKTNEQNLVQVLDSCVGKRKAPKAIYLFPDATTFWGGSQFVNSPSTGLYEDYLIKELLVQLRAMLPVHPHRTKWAIVGGSSGGYGAFHLASKYPELFGWVAASAPDSGFEWSLLPDIYRAGPYLKDLSFNKIKAEVQSGALLRRSEGHSILNAVAMAACYSPKNGKGRAGEFEWPVDFETGELIPRVWRRWQDRDPIHFLEKRRKQVKTLEGFYLDVGINDQFYLYYGARKIKSLLQRLSVDLDYNEFIGNHFDLHTRRPIVWEWLSTRLK